MAFVMDVLLRVQREQAAFERLIAQAEQLGLPDGRLDRVEQLLVASPTHDLLQPLLDAPGSPAPLLGRAGGLVASAGAASQLLATDPTGAAALGSYSLDSPKLLGAARAHGVDEQILRAVYEQLEG